MRSDSAAGWITPGQIRFGRDKEDRLIAVWNGRSGAVGVKRLFPIRQADGMIAVTGPDGTEWGVIADMAGLDADGRTELERELRWNPFLPRIERIRAIRNRLRHWDWDADTDCGRIEFATGPLYEAAAVMDDGCRIVTDLSDQKYVLPADARLDKRSRRQLHKWL